MDAFNYRDGELFAEGVALSAIAQRFGTPTYVYSRAHIQAQYRSFTDALDGVPHLVCYAVKANSNLGVLNVLARLGAGFDIVSRGELERVLAAGGSADKIVFSGVGKTRDDMRRALEVGVHCFNVESTDELERLQVVAAELGVRAPISLRVNPDVDAGTHPYISTGLKENKFGIAIADAGEHDLVGAAASGQYAFQLATGNDVKTSAQSRQDIQYTEVGVGLDRVADQVRHASQCIGKRQVLGFDVGAGVDVSRCAKAFGDGGQGNPFREQLAVTVVKSVHGVPLLVDVVLVSFRRLLLRGLGLLGRVLGIVRQVQRAFLTTGRHKAGSRGERSKGRDQALHGEILENALIAPEYTGHPAACLCDRAPVRRGLARCRPAGCNPCGSGLARESGGSVNKDVECAGPFASKPARTGAVFDVPISVLGRYPLQSPGLARILRRLSVNRHFLRLPQ